MRNFIAFALIVMVNAKPQSGYGPAPSAYQAPVPAPAYEAPPSAPAYQPAPSAPVYQRAPPAYQPAPVYQPAPPAPVYQPAIDLGPDTSNFQYKVPVYDAKTYGNADVNVNRFPGGVNYQVNENAKGSDVKVSVETSVSAKQPYKFGPERRRRREFRC